MILTILFLIVLFLVAYADIRTMEIPDRYQLAILIIGLISNTINPEISLTERMLGMLITSVPLILITLVVPDGFGGGDIKLTAVCGLMLGWKNNLFALFLAVVTGGVYAMYLWSRKKAGRSDRFAFGPFLCLGTGIAFLWGETVIGWYLNLCGI